MIWNKTHTATKNNEPEIRDVAIQTRIIDAEFEEMEEGAHD